MRLLVHSTAAWSNSSYSVLVKRVIPNVVSDNHHVTLSTWYGLEGMPVPWQIEKGGKHYTVVTLPKAHGDQYGTEMISQNYRRFNCDVAITISDIWVFGKQHTHSLNFAPWFPVDYSPLPQAMKDSMEPAIYPMVMSKWGLQVIEEAGLKAHYVPCSAPTKVYTPGDKQKAREIFHTTKPFDFLVTMIAANKDASDRKGFNEALQAFAKFLEKHPDSMLYCHTNWNGPVNIAALATRLGIADNVIQPDQYAYNMGLFTEDYMVQVNRASDVHLNTCKSEGFGLPILESQMCGCPVIAPDYSTTDELLFAGWKCDVVPDWAFGAESFRSRVVIDSVADALEEAYRNKDNDKLRRKAANLSKRYDNDLIYKDYWRPALAAIEKIVNKGKAVYDVAKNFNMVPIQGRGNPADRVVPEPNNGARVSA